MKPPKYYMDAGVFLALFNDEAERVKQCKQVLKAGERGEIQILTSSFTLVEVIHIKGREKLNKDKEEAISAFFENDYIVLVDVTRNLAESARQLIWQNPSLKPKDAIHAATAIFTEADELHTYDGDLLKLDQKIGNPPLNIQEPSIKEPELDY